MNINITLVHTNNKFKWLIVGKIDAFSILECRTTPTRSAAG